MTRPTRMLAAEDGSMETGFDNSNTDGVHVSGRSRGAPR